MNKRLLAILVPAAVGGVLLGTTAYAAITGPSGYDLYKEAFKNTRAASSFAPKTEVTVKDNGVLLFEVDSTAKINHQNKTMSNKVTIVSGDRQNTLDMYRQNDKTVMKSSESNVYNVMESGKERKHGRMMKHHEPGNIEGFENVVDAFVGDLQNYIALNNNLDGTKEVSLHLADGQIPTVVNAVASLAITKAGGEKEHGRHKEMGLMFDSSLRDKLPKLVEGIKVSEVNVEATITKDNLIEKQAENITITGIDAKGKKHEIVVTVETDLAGYNNTVPETVDLTNKEVKVIEHKKPDNV